MVIYSTPDDYGFWDPSGRNLFFKFPKFSFINIKDRAKLITDHFLLKNFNSKTLEKAITDSKRRIYARIDNNSEMIDVIKNLPFLLLRYGKSKDAIVTIFDEIVIEVKDRTQSSMIALLRVFQSDNSLSRSSLTRPIKSING